MGRRARRAMASTPIIFGNATTATANSNDTVIGYQCTCYRKRCRCGASGVRLLDANSMAQARMIAMNQTYGHGYSCGNRHHRHQGPIAALVGGLVNLAIQKHDEKKAARAAAVEVEVERENPHHQTRTHPGTAREVEEVDDSSDSEYEVGVENQRQGVVRTPDLGDRKSSKKGGNKLRKNGLQPRQPAEQGQERRQSEQHWESGPPPYSA